MLQMFVGSLFATLSFALAFLVSLLSISLCLVVFSSKEMCRRPKKNTEDPRYTGTYCRRVRIHKSENTKFVFG